VLLVGALGLATSDAMRQRLRAAYAAQLRRVPDHRVAFAERARHFVMLDEPDWLFRTIDEFLAGADRAGARPAP
jgi:hypothetical protein